MKNISIEMKSFNRILVILSLVFAAVSCAKGDGDGEYGQCLIYFPQATQSGGINSHYKVPFGEGPYTYNFKVEEDKVLVMLGVTRSGKVAGKAFSVGIVSDIDATEQDILTLNQTAGEEKYVLMPEDMYECPSTVHVEAGAFDTTFYIELSKALLQDSVYSGKLLTMKFKLTDPSEYSLAEKNTVVTLVVDVDALNTHFE